ncbi:Di-copper centre-containing protein [Zalerion maritima]|uniref:Di-copper centre-containing protein n=1 Tax=Zalerion maritima TaxID=339359 RepID=A0AAD5RXG2_9PEZI|nr:Di-copper centre-containing protein [Zalerion maritima]
MHTSLLFLFALTPLVTIAQKISAHGVWTGFENSTGRTPQRRNINDLHQEGGPEWDLYILGMAAFQDAPETETDSYFQVSGIHGYPLQAWNGVESVPGGAGKGYCPHGENLFSTWHRPMVAVFEQILAGHIQRIAEEYNGTNSEEYQKAADEWRLPYWDWAQDSKVPSSSTTKTITVNGPEGSTTIPNPLYEYKFQNHPYPSNIFPSSNRLIKYSETKRCVDSNGNSNPLSANSRLEGAAASLRDQVYDVFTRITEFDTMASTGGSSSSFESPHNTIHVFGGCASAGSLYYVSTSAFDPLFMLHHCNIDRLIAIWQAIHYESAPLSHPYKTNGFFSTPSRSTLDARTPLKPFYDENGEFWTSEGVRYLSAFGYTYPELVTEEELSDDELSSVATSRINLLYAAAPPTTSMRLRSGSLAVSSRQGAVSREYFAELKVNREDIPLPSSLDVYLGDKLAGSMTLLSMPESGPSYAEIPLRSALEGVDLDNFASEPMLDYITKNFKLDIRDGDGAEIDRDSISSLEVSLQGDNVIPRTSDEELPQYVKVEDHLLITDDLGAPMWKKRDAESAQ